MHEKWRQYNKKQNKRLEFWIVSWTAWQNEKTLQNIKSIYSWWVSREQPSKESSLRLRPHQTIWKSWDQRFPNSSSRCNLLGLNANRHLWLPSQFLQTMWQSINYVRGDSKRSSKKKMHNLDQTSKRKNQAHNVNIIWAKWQSNHPHQGIGPQFKIINESYRNTQRWNSKIN